MFTAISFGPSLVVLIYYVLRYVRPEMRRESGMWNGVDSTRRTQGRERGAVDGRSALWAVALFS